MSLNKPKNYRMDVALVIDGSALHMKEEENKKRSPERQTVYVDGQKVEENGDADAAQRLYIRACSITREIKYRLVQYCRSNKIKCIVATV